MPSNGSLWLATAPPATPRPPLTGQATCQVAVLGGGIAGLTTAYLLAVEGVDVVLLEALTLGAGATGNTTAKVSSAHGRCYAPLRAKHGAETAAAYATLNERAIALIEDVATREGIECGWRRRDNYTYTIDPSRAQDIADEAEASAQAGLAAEHVSETPLPFPVVGAVRTADQAEFHPMQWLLGLAEAAERAGARIHEGSRALEVSAGRPCTIRTGGGELQAERVVVATHYPTLDRGLFFARLSAHRSYCIGVRTGTPPPEGMFLSIDEPTRSVRSHPLDDSEELLIVGGEGHKVGQDEHTSERFAALEEWATEHFGARSVDYRWSAQDPMPPDGLPYVGALTPTSEKLLVATGFRKWGMTNGTAAAAILRDRILDRDNDLAKTFASNRFDPVAAGPKLVKENVNVAKHMVGDKLARPVEPGQITPGQGAIARVGGDRAAAYRDDAGTLYALGSSCTHLGCEVRFNEAERSWDCPCHGSRFDAVDGRVLEGPAVQPLKPIEE